MTPRRTARAQVDTTVGDFAGDAARVAAAALLPRRAAAHRAAIPALAPDRDPPPPR